MHHLLRRQLKKVFSDKFQFSSEMEAVLKQVSDTYDNYDKDRELLDRSFDISSKEFLELNNKVLKLLEELKIEKANVEQKVIERTQELKQKVEELNQKSQFLIKKDEELTIANNRLLELDKVKTEFISVAAHQLRTPLSAIKWIFSLLISEDSTNLNSEQRSLIMKGYESNERIIHLINDMLVVTRIESGKIQYNFTPIHIEDLINNALLDFTGIAYTRKINLSFEKPSRPLPYINADLEKMRGAIQNLIENAMTYTQNGGRVVLKAALENNMVKVSIKDNGIGIPEHQQSSIFSKFFRADNATKVQTNGSGLGLFIVKNTIEKHGGKVDFESVLGKGTTFYFTLPIANTAAIPSA